MKFYKKQLTATYPFVFLQYVLKFFCKFSLCLLLVTNELVIFAENHKN